MPIELPGRPILATELEAKFQQWRAAATGMHATTRFTPNDTTAWTPVTRSPGDCMVALVSTAGVHLKSQPAYDLMNEHGDASVREIPGDTAAGDIMVSHSHYDTTDANTDPNVVFPLDRLRELAAEGTVGAVSPVHIGMMGWNPDGEKVKRETAPQVARRLVDAGVDIAILTPG